ncbi:MAG: hypothetical protein L0170_07795 [Acidobacteria bacterium]|nr:hypothetical protein [Acidobacteriota bacterium]
MTSELSPRNLSAIKCPACAARLEYLDVPVAGDFRCPTCDKLLYVPSYYYRLVFLGSIACSALFSYWVGLRWFWLYMATLTLCYPIFIIGAILLKRLIPPPICTYEPTEFSLNPFNRLRR